MKHFLTILLLFTVLGLQAASPSAAQVLQRTATTISNAKAIEATFTSYANDIAGKGKITIGGPKFTLNSDGYAVWYDGNQMWSMFEGSGEVSLSIPTADELIEINPFDIINQYAQRFNARLEKSSAKSYTVILTARSQGASIKDATLVIDAQTWLPTQIKATFSNGLKLNVNVTKCTILQQAKPNTAYQFPSRKYPDVELIDLR